MTKISKNLELIKCQNLSGHNSNGIQNYTFKSNLLNRILCLANKKREFDLTNIQKYYNQVLNANDLLKYTEGLMYLMKNKIYALPLVGTKLENPYDYVFYLTYDKDTVQPYFEKYIGTNIELKKHLQTENINAYIRNKNKGFKQRNLRGYYLWRYIMRKDYPAKLNEFIARKEKHEKFHEIDYANWENYIVKKITKWMKEYDNLESFNRYYTKIKNKGDVEYRRLLNSSGFKKFMKKEKKNMKPFNIQPIKAIYPEVLETLPKKFIAGYKKLAKKYKIKIDKDDFTN